MSDEEDIFFQRPLSKCYHCKHFRVQLMHPKKPQVSDKLSWFLALENVEKLWCDKNRIRWKKSGDPKVYDSTYYLKNISEEEGDCPDFEDMRPDE